MEQSVTCEDCGLVFVSGEAFADHKGRVDPKNPRSETLCTRIQRAKDS